MERRHDTSAGGQRMTNREGFEHVASRVRDEFVGDH